MFHSDKGLTLKMSAFKLFAMANLLTNSVDNTKLPCYTLPLMQHHSYLTPFIYKLKPFLIWIISLAGKQLVQFLFKDGTAHQGSVTCIDGHRDNVLVATGSEDSTVKIVNTNSGKVKKSWVFFLFLYIT